ncbi:hypothetical protein HIMB100_00014840 [SAR116 cluster alpha proteobacterium HIMB100]|nr:hypothetical protein HIMB100_00014840 [SAR116 cluster alpha proteobacterium HIMB100]
MLRRYIQIASLMAVLFGLSACQFFIDGRDESLLVVTAEEWAEMHRYKEEKRMAKIDANRPQAMPGSEAISFANLSDAYLAGCRTLGIVEVHHYGTYEEALILMRNQAHQLAASVIVPLDIYQDKTARATDAGRLNFVKGRMLRCPDKSEEERA